MKRCKGGFVFFVTALMFLGLTLIHKDFVHSQDAVEAPTAVEIQREPDLEVIKPAVFATVGRAQLRTAKEMQGAETALAAVKSQGGEVPFMPTDDPAQYRAAKLAAKGDAAQSSPPLAPESLAPPALQFNFEGINQVTAGGAFPPDTHGAVGLSHFVEVVNTRVVVYNKAGALLKSTTLPAFFGSAEFLFDPRVVYDQAWRRWVVVCSRKSVATTDTVRRFFIAVSKTEDPTGSYYTFLFNLPGAPFDSGDWWDFPQLGMDQDAVIITGNVFDTPAGGFKFAAMTAIAKARLYNGLGFFVPVFTGLASTLAPPIVLDQNKNAYFVAANSLTNLHLYRGENLSNAFQATLVLQALVDVPDYAVPPDAPQLGTAQLLDTLDRRFVNASTQVGDSLWNVHTIAFGVVAAIRAAPKFYQIDTEGAGANTVKQQGFIFESGSAHGFNASIAANASGEAFVTWVATDVSHPTAALRHNARVRISGRQPVDPLGTIPAGSAVFTSGVPLTGNAIGTTGVSRWGDYSAVSLDPSAVVGCAANRKAWFVNEKINAAAQWGSRFGRVGFCP